MWTIFYGLVQASAPAVIRRSADGLYYIYDIGNSSVLARTNGEVVDLVGAAVAPELAEYYVLNEREARFDYFYYLGTFNQALPVDLKIALNQA